MSDIPNDYRCCKNIYVTVVDKKLIISKMICYDIQEGGRRLLFVFFFERYLYFNHL